MVRLGNMWRVGALLVHNPENCGYADRTIFLRDGRVVSEGGELAPPGACRLAVAGA